MSDRAVLLRYHEIALKGANRIWFEERLMTNARRLIQRAIGTSAPVEFTRLQSRIVAHCEWNEAVRQALSRVFGISSFSPARTVKTDLAAIAQAAVEEFSSYACPLPRSFRVLTRRSDKALPETSMEIDRAVGSTIAQAFPALKVDLGDPEFTVGVEIRTGTSYVWMDKVPGLGGLPVGTNGRLLCLLSGGLDSPVAAIQMQKRGAQASLLHFYGTPFVGQEVLEKVEDLARIVNRTAPEPEPLRVVPFGKIQEKIALATHPKLRTVLYRRMMVRIACEVAERIGAQALVTGEALGQVASQTLENITTINAASRLPILRPLIAFDKDEIIELAQRWETYEPSIRPAADCCTLFADRHPAIRASLEAVLEQEARFPVQEFVMEAVNSIELHPPRG